MPIILRSQTHKRFQARTVVAKLTQQKCGDAVNWATVYLCQYIMRPLQSPH